MELNHRKNLHYKNSGNNIWNVLSYSYRELFLIENYKYQKEDYTMSEKRNTWQKQVIYSVIKELKTHPTVQSLIDELEKRGYKIGKSTVYRVLSDAVDEGIVMNVYSGDKMEHFDGILIWKLTVKYPVTYLAAYVIVILGIAIKMLHLVP